MYGAAVLAYVIALGVAVAIVPLTSGRYTKLAELEFHRTWLLFVGLALQIGVELVALPRSRYEDVGVGVLLLSYVALLAFCASNLRIRGVPLIGVGIALNAVVIALNLGMPYKVSGGLVRETTVKHRPTRSTDIAVVLSDQLTIGEPVNAAISIGDVMIGVGIVQLAYVGSRRRRRAPRVAHYVDLPSLERRDEIDLRDAQDVPDATTRSSASNTRRS